MVEMYILVYITASSVEEAKKIGKKMVEKRLAACANVVEKISSTYWWKGRLEESNESLLILKSKKDRLEELVEAVRELHSYENPAIAALPLIGGSEDFLQWIGEEVR
jgi:periplasmic divalent cation tolerance protein